MTNTQLPDSPMWFVRAEHNNVAANHFLEEGIVHMGWGIGPISIFDSVNDLMERLREEYPERKEKTYSTWANEILRFNRDMKVGDSVATYEPKQRMCHIGILKDLLIPFEDEVTLELDNDYVHQVEWLFQIPKDTLSEYTQKRLGIPLTLHRLSVSASAELRGRCAG